MLGFLAIAFIVVPIVELAVIIQVGQQVGVWDTIALLLLISFVGAWLVRREGMSVWRRFNEQMAQGQMPGAELFDGVLILIAGAFLLTPGFVTDGVGLLLLVPPVRSAIRATLRHRVELRIQRGPSGPY